LVLLGGSGPGGKRFNPQTVPKSWDSIFRFSFNKLRTGNARIKNGSFWLRKLSGDTLIHRGRPKFRGMDSNFQNLRLGTLCDEMFVDGGQDKRGVFCTKLKYLASCTESCRGCREQIWVFQRWGGLVGSKVSPLTYDFGVHRHRPPSLESGIQTQKPHTWTRTLTP
jgi:hypothetical protein